MSRWIRVEFDEETEEATVSVFASADYGPDNMSRSVTVSREFKRSREGFPLAISKMVAAMQPLVKNALDSVGHDISRQLRMGRSSAEMVADARDEFNPDKEIVEEDDNFPTHTRTRKGR
jgi:hypothetical protein